MADHQNTHRITADCIRNGDYVLGCIDGRPMVGVTFAPGGWKPARHVGFYDLRYFGTHASQDSAAGGAK